MSWEISHLEGASTVFEWSGNVVAASWLRGLGDFAPGRCVYGAIPTGTNRILAGLS
jgi:hypothetical protein